MFYLVVSHFIFFLLSFNAMKTFLKTTVGILLLCILVFIVDPTKILNTLKKISLNYIVILLSISFILVFISTLKWGLLIKNLGEKISLRTLFSLYMTGYFINLFLPSFLGGDLARSVYIGKKIGQHEAISATFLERYTGFVAMLFLGSFSVFFVDFVTYKIKIAIGIIFIVSLIITGLSLSTTLLKKLEILPFSNKILTHLKKIQKSLLLFKDNHSLIANTFLLSFLFHLITVLNTMVAGWAIGWENPPVLGLFIVLPIIFLISVIPISPNGLGIQEGAFSYFLVAVGATPEQALSIALILRIKGYFLGLIGGIIYTFKKFNLK